MKPSLNPRKKQILLSLLQKNNKKLRKNGGADCIAVNFLPNFESFLKGGEGAGRGGKQFFKNVFRPSLRLSNINQNIQVCKEALR